MSLRVTSFDALARKLPTVTEGVVETNLTVTPGTASNAVLKTYRMSPKAPLESGQYMVVQYGMQMRDFGVD